MIYSTFSIFKLTQKHSAIWDMHLLILKQSKVHRIFTTDGMDRIGKDLTRIKYAN